MATEGFSRSLPMMLYRALDTVMPRFRKIFNEFGLTEQQWRVLRVLWEHQDIAFHALAEFTLIPAPSLVGVVDRLSKSGLVERRRSESDRRNVSIRTTSRDLNRLMRNFKEKSTVRNGNNSLRRSIDSHQSGRRKITSEVLSGRRRGQEGESNG